MYNHRGVKPIEFIGASLDSLRSFPKGVRQQLGFQLDRVQRGLEPFDWKSMPSVGAGVCEIRVRGQSGAYRTLYVARFADAIYVLHCFQKKGEPHRSTTLRWRERAIENW